jgi:5'(3')-deoxyribonucleotidase
MNKKELIIACDVDNVMVDFCYTYLKILNQLTGMDKKYEDIIDFDFSKCVCNKTQDAMVWNYIDNNPGIVSGIPEIPNAFRSIEHLRTLGKVVALTSPHLGPTWMYERAQALMMNFGFTKKEIIFCSDKHLVPGDFLIEDSLNNVNEYKRHHPNAIVFLLDTPYNQGGTLGIRVNNWIELLERIHILT